MKWVRFRIGQEVHYGVVESGGIRRAEGTPFGPYRLTGTLYSDKHVTLLAPCVPGKILATIRNYKSHAEGRPPPPVPQLFFKAPSTVIGPNNTVVIPPDTQHVEEEAEMVVVIGKRAKNVSEAKALDYVLGYTCGNDISARDWQKDDQQWWRAKSSDTFTPIGPCITTGLDPSKIEVVGRIDGKEVQHETTGMLIFSVPTLIAFITRYLTLEPGDLIFTGTPGQPQRIAPGNVVEVEIKDIGTLRNPVKA